jgi:endo-1,4-beta-xylanase
MIVIGKPARYVRAHCKLLALSSWLLILGGLLAGTAQADALSTAPERIERLRARAVTVTVIGRDGRPVIGQVRAEMVRHQFLFGCNLFLFGKMPTSEQNERYRELWSGLFNYATLPFYLARYELAPGETNEAELKAMAAWCRQHGVKAKGHPLIWHFPESVPAWLPADQDAVAKVYRERIHDLLPKFSDEIQYWDVLNEPTTAWMYDNPVATWENLAGPLAVTRDALQWAHEANPQATLVINDYNIRTGVWSLLGYLHPVRASRNALDPVNHYATSFLRFMSDLKQQGGEYNAVGIQSHMHMGGNWPISEVWRTCERYARLGVPIHFTEVTVLSGAHKIMWPFNPEVNLPWPTTPKGEAEQAKYVEEFYTLLFSHPAVEAITWWDFSDYSAWMGAPAGLVRDDLSPKPAYNRLRTLIRETWWTDTSGPTDSAGRFAFHGFCGDYLLHASGDSAPVPFTIDCHQPDGQTIPLQVP